MVDYSTLALVLTGLGLTASILYYAMGLRNANTTQQLALETRQMQLFMQIYNVLNTNESLVNWAELNNKRVERDEYLQKYDSNVNPEHFAKRSKLWYS